MYMLLSFVGVNKWNKKSYFIQYATNCVVVFIYHIHMLYSYIIFLYKFQKKAEEAHNMFAKLGPKIDLVCVKLVRQYVHPFNSDKNTD